MSESILPITVASLRRIREREHGNAAAAAANSVSSIKARNSLARIRTPPEPEEEDAPSPVLNTKEDFSQGWSMLALVFFTNFLVLGFFKSLGILTKILNKEFNSTMHVYILMCITYSLNCVAGPLACYLSRTHSARIIALIGTSSVTFGLILSYFAKSLTFLYTSIGVFIGLGSGLTYPTGVILVGNYFVGTKHAAIANALVVSGSPIGGMIMPLVVSLLSEHYTSRGTFLIIGGVMFNAILCAKSFKSANDRNTSQNQSEEQTLNDNDQEEGTGSNENNIEVTNANPVQEAPKEMEGETEHEEMTIDNNENLLENKEKSSMLNLKSTSGVLKIFEREDEAEVTRRMAAEASLESFCEQGHHHPDQPLPLFSLSSKMGSGTKSVFLSGTGQTIHTGVDGKGQEANVYLRPFGSTNDDFRGRMVVGSFPGLECYKKERESSTANNNNNNLGVFSDNEMVCHYLNDNNEVVAKAAEVNARKPLPHGKASLKTGSHPFVLALETSCVILCSKTDIKKATGSRSALPHHHHHPARVDPPGGDLDLQGSMAGTADDLSDGTPPRERRVLPTTGCLYAMKDWTLASPLRDKTYIFLLLSNISTAISTTNIHLMVSQLVEENSDDYTKSSMIYLVMALADLSGRLLGAFLTDKEVIPPSVIYGIGLISAGISSSFFATYSSFTQICLGALAFGISSGFHVGIYGLLLTNTVGLEKIHIGYGISMCTTGTLQCISILLSGRIISLYRNSFSWLVPLLGSILSCGGALWICALLFCRAGVNSSSRCNRDSDTNDDTDSRGGT